MAVLHCVVWLFFLGLKTVYAAPSKLSADVEHKQSKRNFVPNRFDIIDNEIKHAIQKEVQNALRKNFVPDNPLLEDSKWGRSSPDRYPENQPSMIYGMEYDDINPSRSDPGYLVLDLKQLSRGRLKFHEQQVGGHSKTPKIQSRPAPSLARRQPNVQSLYYNQQQNYGQQYPQYQSYNYAYQPSTQQYMPPQSQQQQQQQQYQQQQQKPYYNANPVWPSTQNPQYTMQG